MEDGPPRFPQGSSSPAVLGNTSQRIFTVSFTGLSPSVAGLSIPFNYRSGCAITQPPPAGLQTRPPASRNTAQTKLAGHMFVRFGLFPFRSPLLGEYRLISFPEGTEMFHFPSFASSGYGLFRMMGDMNLHGFPHSEIPGSMPVSGFPGLIAAVHVLHRLPTPRHPSHALSSLTISL